MANGPQAQGRRSPTALLYVFALLSGASALIYEVAWAKLLALSFGRTTIAASAVLGGFMAGMGAGAWLFHRLGPRHANAVRVYAGLELGIAITTALLTAAFARLPDVLADLGGWVPGGAYQQLFRVGFVVLALLPPAALMGATYPVLCTALIRSREGAARHLGPLYGLNTVGAALGALLAGFVLVEQLGLRGSVAVANALNLAIAAAAWWLGRSFSRAPRDLLALSDRQAVFQTTLQRRLTGLVLFGSGFATLAYEIVWFRALRYLFGNSTYAFTTMLVIFLLGLGIGALLCRERSRRAPEAQLALCQLGIAVLAMLAMALETLILADRRLESSLSIFSAAVHELVWWQRLGTEVFVALLLMLPATLLMGFSFPLATRLFLGDVRRLGQRVGASYLLANLGSIAGAVAAAMVILPRLGTIRGTAAIAVLNLLLGGAVLSRHSVATPRRLALGAAACAAVLGLALVLPPRLPFRVTESIASQPMELVFEEEGDLATVQVFAARDAPDRRAMLVDGSAIGESQGLRHSIYGKQILLAHLPLSLAPGITEVLSIGLGSASTVEALASYPELATLHVVEISQSVVRASRLFAEARVLEDPRVELYVEDVAHFLLQDGPAYDLIVSDGKLGADFSGNTLMVCRDFYDYSARRLAEDGLFIQWLPLAHQREDFAALLRTFLASFRHVEVFFEDPGSVLLVGAAKPVRGRDVPGAGLSPRAQRDLSHIQIPSAEALLSRWIAGGDALRAAVGDGPIVSWDRSRIEYSIYRSTPAGRLADMDFNLGLLLRAHGAAGPNPFLDPASAFAASTPLVRLARWHAYAGRLPRAVIAAERAAAVNPEDPRAREVAAELAALREQRLRRAARERGG